MHNIFFYRTVIITILFSLSLFANDFYDGKAKQDVNVRSMPDYESKIAYVLRKNEAVKIEAIIKTKNKGTWYKIEKGFVVTRFILTENANIPLVNSFDELKELQSTTIKNEVIDIPKIAQIDEELPSVATEINEEESIKAKEIIEETKEVIKTENLEEQIEQNSPKIVSQDLEIKEVTQQITEEKTQEKQTYNEPIVITKDESFISKYINITYIVYGLIGIVFLILLIFLIGKIFSRPSISDQIDQHKKRSDSLKKALSSKEEE